MHIEQYGKKDKDMKKIKATAAALFTLIVAASCGSSKTSLQPEALNGEWNIMTVGGKQATADKQPYIGMDLESGRLYGCAGCNRIIGSVEVETGKAGRLSFGKVGSTRMLCADMSTESAVLEALNKVGGYKGTDKELTLTDSKGNALLTLSKRPEASLASLDGRWAVVAVNGENVEEISKSETKPFLAFNATEKSVHGNGGCNTVNGELTQSADSPTSLRFERMLSTMKACPDMEVEGRMLEALEKVRSFRVDDDTHASLIDENGQEVLTLEKQ